MRVDIKAMQAMIDTMVGKAKFSYPAKKNSPRPADEFAHIQLLEEYQDSIPGRKLVSEAPGMQTFNIVSLARLRFRIGVVETDGQASVRIMHGWTSTAMKELMISLGYGFILCTPISLEDAELEKEWEQRQGFSVELYVTRIFEETVDIIKQLVIKGEYVTNKADSVLLNYDINNS